MVQHRRQFNYGGNIGGTIIMDTPDLPNEPLYGITLNEVPSGSFQMGSNYIGYLNEEPIHTVTLSSFSIDVTEITQGQYKAIMGLNPAYFSGDDNLPVEQVSWWDAIKFCNTLSLKTGFQQCYNESTGDCDFAKNGFRLPTEAEWEYACRAGTLTNYYTGDSDNDLLRAGWYSDNSNSKTNAVAQKVPNAWGLYDMHGNVCEWCYDWYGNYSSNSVTNPTGASQIDSNSRTIRGGGWNYIAVECRSTNRSSYSKPENKLNNLGFRVVRSK